MSGICKVIRVKSWSKDQGEFVEINESDFDEAKHTLYVEKSAAKKADASKPADDANKSADDANKGA